VSAKSAELLIEVLALPTEERAELAVELLASLDDVDADVHATDVHRAWGEEMTLRSRQIASGEVETAKWDDVLQRDAHNRSNR
jgi:hypothetical protein